jgi:hypothetical protein
MVKGFGIFADHFRDYGDRYVLIGGTACHLALEKAGLPFRVTRDFDIVLCIEALDSAFVKVFWEFIQTGRYQIQQKSEGAKQFYRFFKPEDTRFPSMLELFSRKPDALDISRSSVLTPIPVEEDVSSLSAILLDDGYYGFIQSGKTTIEGVPVIGADRLIPLKAKAWLDLSERKGRGEEVDGKTIKKHKNDIFRLYQILDPENIIELPAVVAADMKRFAAKIAGEAIDFKALGLGGMRIEDVLNDLRSIFGIS